MKGILLVLLDYLAAFGAKLVPHTCRMIHAYTAVTTFRQIVKTLVMLDQATIETLEGHDVGIITLPVIRLVSLSLEPKSRF